MVDVDAVGGDLQGGFGDLGLVAMGSSLLRSSSFSVASTAAAFNGPKWARINPAEALLQAAGARRQRRGSTREIVGLDLARDRSLRALVEHVRPTL